MFLDLKTWNVYVKIRIVTIQRIHEQLVKNLVEKKKKKKEKEKPKLSTNALANSGLFHLLLGCATAKFGPFIEEAASLTRYLSLRLILIRPESPPEPRNKVGSQSKTEKLMGFETRSFRFYSYCNQLGHSPWTGLEIL